MHYYTWLSDRQSHLHLNQRSISNRKIRAPIVPSRTLPRDLVSLCVWFYFFDEGGSWGRRLMLVAMAAKGIISHLGVLPGISKLIAYFLFKRAACLMVETSFWVDVSVKRVLVLLSKLYRWVAGVALLFDTLLAQFS